MAPRTTKKVALVKGRRLRVTRLDSCGRPVYGDDAVVTSKGFVSVGFTANTTTDDEIRLTNAAGETIVYEASVTTLSGYGIEIVLGEVDPELFSLLTGQNVVLDADGNPIGFDIDTKVVLTDGGFALELWAGAPAADDCDDDEVTDGIYGYLLLPFLQGGILGDFSVENGAITFTITGANTKDGNAWGEGPFDVMLNAAGDAIDAPVITLGTTTATTGTFPAGTYYWKVTATNDNGETLGSNEITKVIVLNDRQQINWTLVDGATGYKIYRGTAPGVENKLVGTVGAVATFTDTGSAGTTAALPTANTTEGPKVAGPMLSPVSTTTALRILLVDVAPPEALTGSRPLLDPSNTPLVSVTPDTTTGSYEVEFAVLPDPEAGVGVWYDFGDGTWDYVETDEGDTTHTYTAAGTYTVMASTNGDWVTDTVTVPGA